MTVTISSRLNHAIFIVLLASQALIYGIISYQSQWFTQGADVSKRPIVMILMLFAIQFILHLCAWKVCSKNTEMRGVTYWVLGGAILFRLILLPSCPILEIDIYRYLWDGAVVSQGENPYRYSPKQLLEFQADDVHFKNLESLKERSKSLKEALSLIHYGNLITIYPPVSQLAFATGALLTPDHATLHQRVLLMKLVLILFDLGVLCFLIMMLKLVGMQSYFAILYGWNPLILKECANSGHLDSIAVFFTAASVYTLLRGLYSDHKTINRWLIISGLSLGLGIGAKLYPVVMLPILSVWILKRKSLLKSLGFGIVALSAGFISLSPMLMTRPEHIKEHSGPLLPNELPVTNQAGLGLTTFLSRWEMNDFLFMVVLENLRAKESSTKETPLWFVLPWEVRVNINSLLVQTIPLQEPRLSFLAARVISIMFYGIFLAGVMWGAWRKDTPQSWLNAVFLSVAWFWAWSPTLNPWYWTWVMPFLPFAVRKSYLTVSIVVFAYYLRFWFEFEYAGQYVWGTPYQGEFFFHFVVIPIEHGSWLTLLLLETLFFRKCDIYHRSFDENCVE